MSSYLDALLDKVEDTSVATAIRNELNKHKTNRQFGLVFEDHLPETVRLPSHPIRRGLTVQFKMDTNSATYVVQKVTKGEAVIKPISGDDEVLSTSVDDLIAVRAFGDAIYPGFKLLTTLNSEINKPSHLVINGENYHALEALLYAFENKVDCVYIDPPYNTGEKDWIYNDKYIDGNDEYMHSKWLGFMQRRLSFCKRLLSENGTLAISIGKEEVHRLALLCSQMFKSHNVHTVTVQTSGGKPSGGMNYVHEYVVMVLPTNFEPTAMSFTGGVLRTPWEGLTLSTFNKVDRPNQVYPIFVNNESGAVVGVGKSLTELSDSGDFTGDLSRFEYTTSATPKGCSAVWPITARGDECVWRLIPNRFLADWEHGYIKVSANNRKNQSNKFSVQYLPSGVISKIEGGSLKVLGTEPGLPTLLLGENTTDGSDIPTVWSQQEHFTVKGTAALKEILQARDFPYPKPVDLIKDVLTGICGSKKDALIVDFFGGTGTTFEAVSRMNEADGGQRKSIIVTNNELSAQVSRSLSRRGIYPGDIEWEESGVFNRVTKPRITTVTTGLRGDGSFYSEGFPENVAFFELTYEDRDTISLGRAFGAVAPLLWMKAGAQGPTIDKMPKDVSFALPDDAIYGVLFDAGKWKKFITALRHRSNVRHVFITTNSIAVFQQIVSELPSDVESTMLYEDYLSTFEINTEREISA